MSKRIVIALVLCVAAASSYGDATTPTATPAATAAPAPPPSVDSLADMFRKGVFTSDYRLRYEQVDDDGFAETGDAFTLRSRNGFRTAALANWSAYAEIESVYALRENYNSTANRRTQYPTVADPEGSEFNQAYVAYGFNTPTQAILGRQRIAYDNQRFFGNVGFRQNEQTFDALTFNHVRNGYGIKLAYLDEVHRVFGNSNPNPLLRQLDLSAFLLNGSYQFQPSAGRGLAGNTISVYSYFVENQDQPLTSNRIVGMRYAGGVPVAATHRFFYTAEYAQQDDYESGSALIDADYRLLELGISFNSGRFSIKAAQEMLGGDGSYAFQTPFATLHAFNGWADRFLITPNTGLVDRYLEASAKLPHGALTAQFHHYQADSNNLDYGDELGLQYVHQLNDRFNFTVKWADYRADGFGRNATKTWLFVDYKR
jgi:Alginate export